MIEFRTTSKKEFTFIESYKTVIGEEHQVIAKWSTDVEHITIINNSLCLDELKELVKAVEATMNDDAE